MKQVTLAPAPNHQRRLDAEADPRLKALIDATPAEIEAYINAHVATLADARLMLKSFALALRYLLKRD